MVNTPVPASQPNPPAPTVRTSAGVYTHRTWKDEMADVLGHIAGIYRDLEQMDATLHEVQAGRTQLNLVNDVRLTALDLMVRGVRFVEETDARYMAVFEAIQSAGGLDEVAKDKRYHDRD